MTDTLTYRFCPSQGFTDTQNPTNSLLVADSWLADDGRACGLALHQKRFVSSCHTLCHIPEKLALSFWEKAMAAIPTQGKWFPRIELAALVPEPLFQLRIRPAPPIGKTVRLSARLIGDFRKSPRHKGPDMKRSGEIRQEILADGAQEALIVTPRGFVLEGLTTSILWWQDNALYCVPPANRILDGVTSQLVLALAREKGFTVREKLPLPADLSGRKVWAVNALHGIRQVVNWEKAPFRVAATAIPHEDWNSELVKRAERI